MMRHAHLGLSGRYRFGGRSVSEFEPWQDNACLYSMRYPIRDWEHGAEDPDFRRSDPVNDAEAFSRAVSLRRSVVKHLGGEPPR